MLTPSDLVNGKRASGFDRVSVDHGGSTRPQPYRAQFYGSPGDPNNKYETNTLQWKGPRRATAIEAAQDYCDYVNHNDLAPAKPSLRSAGHSGRRKAIMDDPEVKAALGVLRDAKGQRQRKQGYVYCISDGEYVKVGYSTNPPARPGELQTGNARQLTLLGFIKDVGYKVTESELHAKYISDNVLGEWFRPSPALLSEFGIDGKAVAA